MHRITALFLALAMMLCSFVPSTQGYSLLYTDASATTQIRWPTTTIQIALSTSLNSPPPNIKAGSDVVGAAQRALARWSQATGIQFNVTTGGPEAIGQDGVSVITVSQANASQFSGGTEPQGRARIFYNPANGLITEADVAINPNSGVQFSTDGTNNTFDLESTFMHEIGHLLGLEHSGIVGATMQPRQSLNGYYSLPAFTMRTLSDDDRAGARAIYFRSAAGTVGGTATLRGTVTHASSGSAAFGAHVWLEEVATGRAVAGNIAISNGAYRIDGIAPGRYRVIVEQLDEPVAASQIASRTGAYTGLQNAQIPFRTTEAGEVTLLADEDRTFNIAVGNQPFINPTQLGVNNFISSVPVPLAPGTYTFFVAGDNLTQSQISQTGVQITSPFFSVNQSSVSYQTIPFNGTQLPLISFQAILNPDAPSGDYSIRVQANSGEVAYITGGLAVENPSVPNPIDNNGFFVRQHYLDFLDREPEPEGFNYWLNILNGCGTDRSCLNRVRVEISSRFFAELEFQRTGYYVMRLYRAAYGQFPNYQQFIADRRQVQNNEASQRAFAAQFVGRAEFQAKYGALNNQNFVNLLYDTTAGAGSFAAERQAHITALTSGQKTRADVLHEVANLPIFAERTPIYNQAWVRMQYFGYLRRDAEAQGEAYWINVINNQLPNNYQAMICAFLNSAEYQLRFGAQRGRFSETDCGVFY
jgi:predicted Zn-dependent protease